MAAGTTPRIRGQVKALMKKNLVLRKRKICETFFEIAMPLLYPVFLIGMRSLQENIDAPAVAYFPEKSASFPSLCPPHGGMVAFAPNGPKEQAVMNAVLQDFGAASSCLQGFSGYTGMYNALVSGSLSGNAALAVHLDLPAGSGEWSYQLMTKNEVIDVNNDDALTKHIRTYSSQEWSSEFDKEGVLRMQWVMDRALAQQFNASAKSKLMEMAGYDLKITRLPMPSLKTNYNPNTLWFPLLMIPIYAAFGIMQMMPNGMTPMAFEKEKKLDQGMRMNGLASISDLLGWFFTLLGLHVLDPFVTGILLKALDFIPNGNLGLIFVTLLLHSWGCIALMFLLRVVITKAAHVQAYFWSASAALIGAFVGLTVSGPFGSSEEYNAGGFWICCLFSPVATMLGISQFTAKELAGLGLDTPVDGNFPLLGVWAFQLLDIFIYVFLAWYLEQVVPNAYGANKPWNFKPWQRPSSRIENFSVEQDDAVVVKVSSLAKEFAAVPSPVRALTDLSFEMKQGEVTALLGQNGAGKSTAINILTGLATQTSGTAEVYGLKVPKQMDAIRQFCGICPQHDLLFDKLTVMEHLWLFAGIKGIQPESWTGTVDEWLGMLGIADKKNSYADTLSGGQKRKLSLCLALLGDPKFVLLDEPTAGMDPESRRAVWDVVQNFKDGRAILLTTHFMDEADALADHVCVVSKGMNVAQGSPMDLKAQYGSGYRLTVALKPSASPEFVLDTITKHVATAKLVDMQATDAKFKLPHDEVPHFVNLFKDLEENSDQLCIESYGVSQPSLQEVFLSILDKERDKGAYDGEALSKGAVDDTMKDFQFSTPPVKTQVGILVHKWWMLIQADRAGKLQTLLLSSLLLWLSLIVPVAIRPEQVKFDPHSLPKSQDMDARAFKDIRGEYPLAFLPGTGELQGTLSSSSFKAELGYKATPGSSSSDPAQPTVQQLSESIAANTGAYAAFALQDDPGNSWIRHTSLLVNASYPNALPCYLNLLDNALFETAAPGLKVKTKISQMPQSGKNVVGYLDMTLTMLAPMGFMLSALFLLSSVTNTVGKEKFNLVKQLILLMGIDIRLYYAAHILCEAGTIVVTHMLIGNIVALASGAIKPAGILPLLLIEFFAIPGNVLYLFMVVWAAKDIEQTVFATVLTFMFSMLPSFIIGLLENANAKMGLSIAIQIFPVNQFTEGVRSIVMIQSWLAMGKKGEAKIADYFVFFYDPLQLLGYGDIPGLRKETYVGPLLILLFAAVSLIVYALALYFLEVRSYLLKPTSMMASGVLDGGAASVEVDAENEDVRMERQRIADLTKNGSTNPDGLLYTLRLKKRFAPLFKKPFTAVQDVTFGVDPGNCFAMLGTNGAGKTTCINVLTGTTFPSDGTAAIDGNRIPNDLQKIFQVTGFCPQFKGFYETLTVQQHLDMFMRIKGLSGTQVQSAAAAVLDGYGLGEHANKKLKSCSGGTQRKLSTAIALNCGMPKVSFLDEPTTGVDVGTRRFIWDRIKENTKGRIVMLTTHYMDEADELASRIGIMVRGRMAVVGSSQHLKATHGGAYRFQVKGPADTASQVKEKVAETFTVIREVESHEGLQVFEVANDFKMSQVFEAFEALKKKLGVETYSLSQSSLEDVFLNIVKLSEAEEDERWGKKKDTE
eukprot:TRINITY_DN14242_c0_g1_i1.p1 TRINITY_DN14242_c0_g1~~TRINITY_DN14242_c0_g1_i1.p1  ORF type:complete len:1637 (-),score=334.42 TRINITY_DN14242_c0_g1_i1:548-5458(-)